MISTTIVVAITMFVAAMISTTIVVAIAMFVAAIVFATIVVAITMFVVSVRMFFGQSNPVDTVDFKRGVIVELQTFSAIIANFKRIEIAKLTFAATYAIAIV